MSNKIELIKELRNLTNVSMAKCSAAIENTGGNIDEAIKWLQEQGAVDSVKKSFKEANEGLIYSYVHMNKLGVLVEVNCQTDFAARSEEFKEFAEKVALQIVSTDPPYIRREDVPAQELDSVKQAFQLHLANTNKSNSTNLRSPEMIEKIINGKLNKWFAEVCLSEQKFVGEQNITIEQLRTNLVMKISENVIIRRFVRYELGKI